MLIKFKRMTALAVITAAGLLTAVGDSFDFHVRAPGAASFDLQDLNHKQAYEFGVRNWSVPGGHQIVGATLTFYNIYDWRVEDDILFVNLLDDPSGTSGYESYGPQYSPTHPRYSTFTYQGRLGEFTDNAGDNAGQGNDFAGQGVEIGTWSDPIGGIPTGLNLVFEFTAEQVLALAQYAKDGNFALGIDPDCHYFNDGVVFTIHTQVPETTGTLLLLSLGVGCLIGYRRMMPKPQAVALK